MNNQRRVKGFLDGEPGASLFSRTLFTYTQPNELPDLFKKVAGMKDHRLLAIVTALIVEDRIDKILAAFLPEYNSLVESNEFVFSLKLKLLQALNFIPPGVIIAGHHLRKIRNEFAHQLNNSQFSELSDKLKEQLKGWGRTNAIDITPDDLHLIFQRMAFFCITSLDFYTPAVAVLSERVRHPSFEQALANESDVLQFSIFAALDRLKAGEAEMVGQYVVAKVTDSSFTVNKIAQPSKQ